MTPSYDPYMMDTDLPTAPDFSKLRDEYDVVGWDMEPGDVIVFGPTVCHGSDANRSNERDRRALAFRYAGDDVTYAPRHATMPLLWYLRDHAQLTGTKFGCGIAACGACTVHVDGLATRSCVTPVQTLAGKSVTTIEGLADGDALHAVQQAWIEEDVPQCGYCINGWVLTAAAMLEKNPKVSDAEIREGLAGLKCRCGTHMAIMRAVKRAAKEMA